ncbi:MAG TPA: NlpC/P60 family protein [Candidatus Paceibacterota bacterium]|nr:NlpC/P60 family protein [Candidatus Paceibacterota bacterium]
MAAAKPKFILLKNCLAVARGSAGSNAFRKLYYKIGGREIDVLRDGDLSCAVFVSFILKIFSLIPEIHTTVKATEADLGRAGWREIKQPRPGAIVFYGPKTFKSGETHRHIGIYLGSGRAISNSSKNRSPKIHKWNYRPVEKILFHKRLYA